MATRYPVDEFGYEVKTPEPPPLTALSATVEAIQLPKDCAELVLGYSTRTLELIGGGWVRPMSNRERGELGL